MYFFYFLKRLFLLLWSVLPEENYMSTLLAFHRLGLATPFIVVNINKLGPRQRQQLN